MKTAGEDSRLDSSDARDLIVWGQSIQFDIEAIDQQHRRLVDQVVEFKQRYEAGDATVSMELMTFLKNWLLNHIDNVDRKYVPVLKGK